MSNTDLEPPPSQVVKVDLAHWNQACPNPVLIKALEAGQILYFSNSGFDLKPNEHVLLNPRLLAPKSRNISLQDARTLKGAAAEKEALLLLQEMMQRYRNQCQQLLNRLFPAYAPHLRYAPTSFRPAEVANRSQSWRADDKRLHVDAFPSRPNRGERILRVFANINPNGVARHWRVGEPFEDVARRFIPTAKPYRAWQATVMQHLKVTKTFRTEYDHLMLQLHDAMKANLKYQHSVSQESIDFMPGTAWICFSDQTSHAAMSGQFMLEQTVHIAADKLYDLNSSPLSILEKILGRPLI